MYIIYVHVRIQYVLRVRTCKHVYIYFIVGWINTTFSYNRDGCPHHGARATTCRTITCVSLDLPV